jgi:hypothetical protein
MEEMNIVLALFMLQGILQKQTQRSYYSKNCLTLSLSETFLHFTDNSTPNEYQSPAKLFKTYPTVQQLNK